MKTRRSRWRNRIRAGSTYVAPIIKLMTSPGVGISTAMQWKDVLSEREKETRELIRAPSRKVAVCTGRRGCEGRGFCVKKKLGERKKVLQEARRGRKREEPFRWLNPRRTVTPATGKNDWNLAPS